MSKRYLRHPLLQNPSLWLNKRKYLSPESYVSSYYNSDSLKYDPFAQLLALGTAMDMNSKHVFPRGSLVRMTVDNQKGDQIQYIAPAITSPPRGVLYSKSYIVNNWLYVAFSRSVENLVKYIPMKLRYKNNSMKNVQVLEDIENVIPRVYLDNILEQSSRARISKGDDDVGGVILDVTQPSENNKLPFSHGGNFPESVRNKLQEIFPSRVVFPICKENSKIAMNITLLSNYYS